MVQSITAAVTQSVLGELQKAGIFAGHPDQQQDIELSQTVATASPDEAQRTTSANTTTINNIDALQLPAMLFANTSKKPDGTNEIFDTSYKPLGRPLYTKVNVKFQEKIRANEFVDMADILDPPSDLEPYDFHLAIKNNGRVGLSSGKKKNIFPLRHGQMHSAYLHLF